MGTVIKKEIKAKVKHLKEMMEEFKGLALKLNLDSPIVILYEDSVHLVGEERELETLLLYAQELVLEYRELKEEIKFIL